MGQTNQSGKINWRRGGILLFMAALAIWLTHCWVQRQWEYTRALSLQTILVNASIAQGKYYTLHAKYATYWEDIIPFMGLTANSPVVLAPLAHDPQQCLLSFPQEGTHEYIGTLQLNADGQGGQLYLQPTGDRGKHYQLRRTFPLGETTCISSWVYRGLCKRFSKNTERLEFDQLVPVPSPKPVQ